MADKNASDRQSASPDRDGNDHVELTDEEQHQVDRRQSVGSRVVHEVVRRSGDEELSRPFWSLWWSGLSAGFGISTSILGEGLLSSMLPDSPWRPAVAGIGYTLGFLIVILGRLQLFTESTLSAVIPVATKPDRHNLWRLMRLWTIVLLANLMGTLIISALVANGWVGFPENLGAMIDLSRKLLDHDWLSTMRGGVPAGFFLAAIAWAMPSGRGQEFWITFLFTYFIGLGHFSHVIAGSGEAWLLTISGEASVGWAIFGYIVPALIGNVVGGTVLFALLAHAQVRHEL